MDLALNGMPRKNTPDDSRVEWEYNFRGKPSVLSEDDIKTSNWENE